MRGNDFYKHSSDVLPGALNSIQPDTAQKVAEMFGLEAFLDLGLKQWCLFADMDSDSDDKNYIVLDVELLNKLHSFKI